MAPSQQQSESIQTFQHPPSSNSFRDSLGESSQEREKNFILNSTCPCAPTFRQPGIPRWLYQVYRWVYQVPSAVSGSSLDKSCLMHSSHYKMLIKISTLCTTPISQQTRPSLPNPKKIPPATGKTWEGGRESAKVTQMGRSQLWSPEKPINLRGFQETP